MTPGTTRPTAAPADDPVRAALGDPQTLEHLHLGIRVLLRRAMPGTPPVRLTQLADDIVSRTSEAALAGQFDTTRGTSVRAWLFGIGRMMVRKEASGRKPGSPRPAAFDWDNLLTDPAPPPDEQAAARAEAGRVRAALVRLDPWDRTLLEMHYFDGLTAAEIGSRLNASPATVRVWLHRARKAAEKFLAPSRGEADP